MEKMMLTESSEFSVTNRKKLDELVGLIEDLVINKVRIEKMKSELSDHTYLTIMDQEIRIISQIQDTIKGMSKLKMKNVYSLIPDIVNNEEVDLVLEGQEEEIENSVVNYISKIFKYFIKETITNGSNKIKIQTVSDNKNLNIIIESNEKNIDFEKIYKAMKIKQIDIASLNEEEVETLMKLMGKGNNYEDILKLRTEIISLGGSIKIQGKLNEYKSIAIIIPVTSSITQALLVKVSGQVYAIPLEYIETIINKNSVKIKSTSNTDMIVYRNKVIPIIKVSEKLNISEKGEDSTCILIVNVNNTTTALLVDSLLDQTDVVIRSKPSVIKDIIEIKGTTILGDGIVTLVLDVASLVKVL